MLKTVTNSSRSTFLDCPFRYFCEYVRRLTPTKIADYFKWGTLVHFCLEALDNREKIADAIERFTTELEERQPPVEATELAIWADMLITVPYVVDAYLIHYGADEINRYESMGVEKSFSYTLANGIIFRGKIDRVVLDTWTGKYYTWERKTPAQTGPSYYIALQHASQPKGYILAARKALGIYVEGTIYDIIKKAEPKKSLSPQELGQFYMGFHERYFERPKPLVFSDEEIEAYESDLLQATELMKYAECEGLWPKHHPGNRYGGCAYAAYCLHGEETVERGQYYTRPIDELHPELNTGDLYSTI